MQSWRLSAAASGRPRPPPCEKDCPRPGDGQVRPGKAQLNRGARSQHGAQRRVGRSRGLVRAGEAQGQEAAGASEELRRDEDESESRVGELERENAMLRELVVQHLQDMAVEDREQFLAAHEALVSQGKDFLMELPSLSKSSPPPPPPEAAPEPPQEETTNIATPAQDEGTSYSMDGAAASVSVHDDEITFKFNAVPGQQPSLRTSRLRAGMFSGGSLGRRVSPYVLSATPIQRTVSGQESSSAGQGNGEEEEYEGKGKEEEEKEEGKDAEAAPTATPSNVDAGADNKQAEGPAYGGGPSSLQLAAQREVDKHNGSVLASTRSHWLYFTVPEVPVAGADVVVYFNKNVSEPLRYSHNVQLRLAFNEWELEAGSSLSDMTPTTIPHDDGSDWWSCQFTTPTEAYEMNFVFGDGVGTYDNNCGDNFMCQVAGGMSQMEWLDGAPARAAAAEAVRKAAEEAAVAEAEKQRQADLARQDLERAQWRIGEVMAKVQGLQAGAVSRCETGRGTGSRTLWLTKPEPLVRGSPGRLLYNSRAGALSSIVFPEGQCPTLSIGCNGWNNPQDILMTRATDVVVRPDEEWWEATFDVPLEAVEFTFVVKYYDIFDNNNGADHKLLVPVSGGFKAWEAHTTELLRQQEFANRIEQERIHNLREAKRQEIRQKGRDKARAVARRQIKHVMFTQPSVVKAGEEVTVYYSPNDTPLNGCQDIYLLGGWNRWTHRKNYGPLKMMAPKEGNHWRASVTPPRDAYMMDFVFANVSGGDGIYDNRGGLDYHLPIEGSVATEPPLNIVHISVEMAPIAKVGGLADVVTSLGRAVKEQGHLVEIILPRYDFFLQSPMLNQMQYETEFDWGGTHIYVSTQIVEGLRVFFIEPMNGFFSIPTVYGRIDDGQRFNFFCKAAMEFLLQTGRQPDILHCHDWSTASVARSYWEDYHYFGLWKPRVVFTIHNLNYGEIQIGEAAHYAQRFTTVSPSYAFEVGGHPAIAPNVGKFMGIRNGIDTELWDPENDQFLPRGYDADSVVEGKKAAREALSQRLGLAGWRDAPMIGVVSRLTAQKGIHLIKHVAWRTLDRGGIFVLLGSAPDPKIQAEFNALGGQLSGENASFYFAYDEPLSHLVYAACDIIVVPSMFEPCGLSQMIAMRYGAIPCVRKTGGLHDTVFDVDYDKERAAWDVEGSSDWQRDGIEATNGYSFEGTDPGALDSALQRVIDAYYMDKGFFHGLQKRVMLQDWSWNRPALDYIELYYSAMKS
ncbi:unnamed protein product [Ostreobium quekettii]|uniref:starch synthase n=1 Tax=Ostreobium quekettii TaxID=121088 RepID=A0A8S1J040_9CHLO|nr:unnamed protein product [Ostreobium quekettii]|eukprot:evm.model.scf_1064EXC.1 EVM.evm.TU.scf_1064EXC.1   scf_1064EXC:1358-12645(+)